MHDRVLIVDEVPGRLASLRSALEPLRERTVVADREAEALALLETAPADLVVLALSPASDSLALLQQIRVHPGLGSVPVVVVANAGERDARLQSFQAGADEFLEAPVDPTLLLLRVQTLLRQSALQEEVIDRVQALEELQLERRDLVNMVVHDLKSPLSVILANLLHAQSLARTASSEMQDTLQDAAIATERMRRLVSDILIFERLERGSVRVRSHRVDVAGLVDEVGRTYRLQAEMRNQRLRIEATTSRAMVQAEGELIRRVLENLVENALHHTPPGGEVELRVEAGRELVVTVSNTGAPVPEALRQTLFAKFVRGDGESLNHFGLGLYFCRSVAVAHGGSISLVERAGWPVSFRLALPGGEPAT